MSTKDDLNTTNIILNFGQGSIAGAIGLIASHPFDTIKSNIQAKIKTNYNIKKLYAGVKYPLFGLALEKSIVFGTFENTKYMINKLLGIETHPYMVTACSGALAGFMASFIVAPYERFKILRQTNNNFRWKDVDRKFLFKGLSSTFTRETPGFAIYFSVFESLKDHFGKKIELNTFHHFTFGGLSGLVAWLFIYPQDLVKTRIQSSTDVMIKPTMIIKDIYQKGGLRGFFRGFHLALLRAIPLHATAFATWEFLNKFRD